jgi:alpha-L-arabinofuranosidase
VDTLISGWGPFEMMDFCDAIGIEPVFTTNAVGPEKPQDMADLVEYLYGDESTEWGKTRIADGHPKKFSTKFFELGK